MAYELTPLDYAVYGVLCAAKRETGPQGGRRAFRIQESLDHWDDQQIESALKRLLDMGWIRQMSPVLGMAHYEAIPIKQTGTIPGIAK